MSEFDTIKRTQRLKTLGPNIIDRSLRVGTTAGIFSAYNTELNRHVALKVFHPSYSSDLFRAEVQTHEGLSTDAPHVLPLFSYDLAHPNDDTSYPAVPHLVMEKAMGGNVMEHVYNRGALGMRTGISVISRLAEPLDVMQERNTPHSDVKPENVLFATNQKKGEKISTIPIWLTDFGMAGPIDRDPVQGLGTVSYAAPEQMADRRAPTTDQFGLAATLTMVALGERVIPIIDEPSYRKKVSSERFARYLDHRVREVLPKPYQSAVRKAMDPDPERRYDTSGAFANDIAARHSEVMSTHHGKARTIIDLETVNNRH